MRGIIVYRSWGGGYDWRAFESPLPKAATPVEITWLDGPARTEALYGADDYEQNDCERVVGWRL